MKVRPSGMTEPVDETMSVNPVDLAAPLRAWAANHPEIFPPPFVAVESDWWWLRATAAVALNANHWRASGYGCQRGRTRWR